MSSSGRIEGRERFGVDYNIIARSFDPLQQHQRCARCLLRPRQSCPALAVAADKWLDYQKIKGSPIYEGGKPPGSQHDSPGNNLPATRYRGEVRKAGILQAEKVYIYI